MLNNINWVNVVKWIVLSLGYYFYYEKVMPYLVDSWNWAPTFNLIIVPFLLGLVAYYVFSGEHLNRIGYVFLIPAISLMPQLAESDPAKPGLQFFVYYGLIAGFGVGAFVGAGSRELILRKLKKRESL